MQWTQGLQGEDRIGVAESAAAQAEGEREGGGRCGGWPAYELRLTTAARMASSESSWILKRLAGSPFPFSRGLRQPTRSTLATRTQRAGTRSTTSESVYVVELGSSASYKRTPSTSSLAFTGTKCTASVEVLYLAQGQKRRAEAAG